ncbi:leukocyte receptor cluster member 1 homolog [Paramacrobiotus metropolitanus]|uniref:leukocyte receptor cluster member 1 homolog n=1 Tax=Paramacrobiotus metropolitanus TaxID=2943436 RepID=UPI002445612B|nr:leukocyte receptor cluster member 1 homolog [Paramacrobiotus metropolitanus]
MNILPKKRWHVRTKDNIARVRRDEAQAAEEEEERQRRIALAEQEARTTLLREKAKARNAVLLGEKFVSESASSLPAEDADNEDIRDATVVSAEGFLSEIFPSDQGAQEHVNLFTDAEKFGKGSTVVNAEHEAEKRAEKEKYEKSIGYLTYLGQSAQEAQHAAPWYALSHDERRDIPTSSGLTIPHRVEPQIKSSDDKIKDFYDPINAIKAAAKRDSAREVKRTQPQFPPRAIAFTPANSSTRKDIIRADNAMIKRESSPSPSRKSKKKHKKRKHADATEDDPVSTASIPSAAVASQNINQSKSIETLRAERLRREAEEKRRTLQLLAVKSGAPIKSEPVPADDRSRTSRGSQKYNSQFNPHIARQNVDNRYGY